MLKINQVEIQLSLSQWKEIGNNEGKNSKVWLAKDDQLDQALILKKITKKSLDKQDVSDYFAEAKILNKSKHPNIMPIHYSGEDDEFIYITMPYYYNGSLNSIIEKRMLSVREIIKYSLDFLSGLLFIHINGLVHVDIKPSNIILNDSDRAILTDFGLSGYLNEHGLFSQPIQYRTHRSPESYNVNEKSIHDDIYQAGLTLYRMCNGNDSFDKQLENLIKKHNGKNDKIVEDIQKGKFPDRHSYPPHIPKSLSRVINNMLNVDTDKRYNSVLTIINHLSKIDKMLDWVYNKNENNYEWTLNTESSILTVSLLRNQNDFITSAEKLTKGSGNIRKQHKFTGTHDSEKDAFKFLRDKF
ncbi:serine/threonine-protein kinase [Pseudogracilibacillus auburnensis]|uniref:Serine/threonine protein kinase n=1 Tax=Pseudogracilibacillus auburnensis TaxID=1494959 RepID=A0A2V3VMU3_9BACI|nr:serine/threonine-protein kinase [Pseudogracilibacillus auburnensis]PXW82504.1 serine/threonine protein kinase [Pseudogracilibacillus auburnensis]